MSKVSYQILAGITSFLSFTSVFGACYIIYGAVKVRQSLKGRPAKNNPIFITEHVLWMSVCDVLQQLWFGFSWLPVTFDAKWNANWPSIICKSTGTFAQFFLLGSASWNFIISLSLLRMLMATPLHKFIDEVKYNHLFAWGISFICCIIPWIDDGYGYTKNTELNYGLSQFECWIKKDIYQLSLYLPAIIYVLFAVILLIFACHRSKTKKIQHRSTLVRLIFYTIVFVVTWTFPIIFRLYGMISDSSPPPFTVWAHHISLSSVGIGNAIIWGTSNSIKTEKSTTSSKTNTPRSSKLTNTTPRSSRLSIKVNTEKSMEMSKIYGKVNTENIN